MTAPAPTQPVEVLSAAELRAENERLAEKLAEARATLVRLTHSTRYPIRPEAPR